MKTWGVLLTALLAMSGATTAHTYPLVTAWNDTAMVEFQTSTELWEAINYALSRNLTVLDPSQQQAGEAMVNGIRLWQNTYSLTETQVQDAILYWLKYQEFAGNGQAELYVIRKDADFTDTAGNKHYRLYIGCKNPPLVKRNIVNP